MKILAIQFRYLGDAVLMTPALRAIKEKFPGAELHVLVAEEVAPLLQHLPWLAKVWSFPRKRGRANLRAAWPVVRALRREKFDRSVDFVGSDRGALISLVCGARERIGPLRKKGFFGRRWCYTQAVTAPLAAHESHTNFGVLAAWDIRAPEIPVLEIRSDPARDASARELLPGRPILCHLATSQPKKEWPLEHWLEFYQRASAAGLSVAFCAGAAPREQALLGEFHSRAPAAKILPALGDLATFLSVLKQAEVFISGDTGPMHFAAGLGVPTVSLFGPSAATRWAPLGNMHRILQGTSCQCSGATAICRNGTPCMAGILPDQVFRAVEELLTQISGPRGARPSELMEG